VRLAARVSCCCCLWSLCHPPHNGHPQETQGLYSGFKLPMLPPAPSPATVPHLVEGQVAEFNVEGARDVLQVGVVADDQWDVALQLAWKPEAIRV
jgi:hypothetical protein